VNDAGGAPEPEDGVRQYAEASGDAQIHQAGRDLNLYYDDIRPRRRTEPGVVDPPCPYPGLAAFATAQSRWYFGREAAVAELVERLHRRLTQPGSRGLQVVMAPSGAGKSSLLRAGLVPELAKSRLPGSARWPVQVCTPSSEPMRALTACVAALLGVDEIEPERCVEALSALPHAVLVVDQFEELFTLCGDERQRHAFVELLAEIAAIGDEQASVLVVLGLRADFCSACAEYPHLRAALGSEPLLVGPMAEPELRAAIRHPARDVGLDIEDGLVELLLRDLGGGSTNYAAGRLPLLAHALQASWRHRQGATLTVQGYQSTGGLQQAVAQSAELAFAELRPDPAAPAGYERPVSGGVAAARLLDQDARHDLVRSFFLRLVRIGHGADDARRRVRRRDLLEGLPPAATGVLEVFTAARLLTQDRPPDRDDDNVEITHEVLLRAWPRLRAWLNDDRADTIVYQELEESAAGWDGTDSSALLRGARLGRAITVSARQIPSPRAEAFLAASTRQQRAGRLVKRATAAVVVLLLATVGTVYVLNRQQQARTAHQAELARIAAANQAATKADAIRQHDPSLSLLLSQAAYRIDPSVVGARSSLLSASGNLRDRRIREATSGRPGSLAYDGRGRLFAVGADGAVRRWDPAQPGDGVLVAPAAVPAAGVDPAARIAVDKDGTLVAVVTSPHRLQLWDATDQRRPAAVLTVADRVITDVALDRTGSRLAIGTDRNEARLYEVSGRRQLLDRGRWTNSQGKPLPPAVLELGPELTHVKAVEFSPDGRILAIGSTDSSINLRTVARPTKGMTRLRESTSGTILDLEFAMGGKSLTALRDEVVEVWDVRVPRTARVVSTSDKFPFTVTDLAVRPDGGAIAVGGADGPVRMLDGAARNRLRTLPQASRARTLAFDPDGRVLATGSTDGTAHLWTMSPADPNEQSAVHKLATGGRGDVFAQARANGRIDLLRLSAGGAWTPPVGLVSITGYDATKAIELEISQDGSHLAVTTPATGRVDIWDISDASQPAHRRQIEAVPGLSARFIGDRTLATLDSPRKKPHPRLQLWDITAKTGAPIGTWAATAPRKTQLLFPQLSVSPDRRTAAVYTRLPGEDAILLDVSNPRAPREVGTIDVAAQEAVTDIVFDGRGTAAVNGAGAAALWNVTDPRTPARITDFTGYTNAGAMAFSPAGRTVAVAADDHSIVIWTAAGASWTGGDLAKPTAVLSGHTDTVDRMGFAADGDTLISVGGGALGLWSLDADTSARLACQAAGTPLTEAEWARGIPGLPFAAYCGK
jgi:WD40 repeat protein